MRELGLVGSDSKATASGGVSGGASGGADSKPSGGSFKPAPPNIKDVDALFAVLDKDGGGDLDLSEITHGLKELQLKAKNVAVQVAAARERADFWKEMGAATRNASGVVAAWEAAVKDLQEVSAIGFQPETPCLSPHAGSNPGCS